MLVQVSTVICSVQTHRINCNCNCTRVIDFTCTESISLIHCVVCLFTVTASTMKCSSMDASQRHSPIALAAHFIIVFLFIMPSINLCHCSSKGKQIYSTFAFFFPFRRYFFLPLYLMQSVCRGRKCKRRWWWCWCWWWTSSSSRYLACSLAFLEETPNKEREKCFLLRCLSLQSPFSSSFCECWQVSFTINSLIKYCFLFSSSRSP